MLQLRGIKEHAVDRVRVTTFLAPSQFGNNREYMEYRDFSGKSGFFNFLGGVPGIREGLRKVSGGGTLHSSRIWARTEPSRPNSTRCS